MKRADINDEVLSAYMDGELDAQETVVVRDLIEGDPDLSARLAELTAVDALVRKHAHVLDQQPIPPHVLQRLEHSNAEGNGARVVHVDFMRRSWHFLQSHSALAASLVLALGLVVFVAGRMTQQDADHLQTLASSVSGDTVKLDNDTTLVTRFSFRDGEGRYCRQYRLQTADQSTENVACRSEQGWVVVASLDAMLAEGGEYRPASQLPAMESLLDDMMQGAPLSLSEEQALIRNDWRVE